MFRRCPTAGGNVIQTFVLEFPGQLEVLSNCRLLGATGIRPLRDLYHSIPLGEGNPTHSVQSLSARWFNGYPYFCTFVLRASTFKLLATECYCFLD